VKLRPFINLTVFPIFLVLGVANACILVFTSAGELSDALHQQAVAATTVVAEYLSSSPGFEEKVRSGEAREALRLVTSQLKDLDSLYVTSAEGITTVLLGKAPALGVGEGEREGFLQGLRSDGKEFYVVDQQHLPNGSIVGSQVDASGAVAIQFDLYMEGLLIILLSAFIAIVTASLLSLWLNRDIQAVENLILHARDGHPDKGEHQSFVFRETREAAEAVTLLRNNLAVDGTTVREAILHCEQSRTLDASVIATHRARFADRDEIIHGVKCGVRLLAGSSVGAFYALLHGDQIGGIVLGSVPDGDQAKAFASALRAQVAIVSSRSSELLEGKIHLLHKYGIVQRVSGLIWNQDGVVIASYGDFASLFGQGTQRPERRTIFGLSECSSELRSILHIFNEKLSSNDVVSDLNAIRNISSEFSGLIAAVDFSNAQPTHLAGEAEAIAVA
jgi:hypothetical protein